MSLIDARFLYGERFIHVGSVRNIVIRRAQSNEIEVVGDYILNVRRELYPMLDNDSKSGDLPRLKEIYIDDPRAFILIALNDLEEIVATIGLKPFDNRFDNLDYSGANTAEVVKLFVNHEYRRLGLGSRLVNQLVELARQIDYQVLYLHTHPFLKGAVRFWEICGFKILLEDSRYGMVTIHMDCQI